MNREALPWLPPVYPPAPPETPCCFAGCPWPATSMPVLPVGPGTTASLALCLRHALDVNRRRRLGEEGPLFEIDLDSGPEPSLELEGEARRVVTKPAVVVRERPTCQEPFL